VVGEFLGEFLGCFGRIVGVPWGYLYTVFALPFRPLMPNKSYRGQLPKPDSQGRWRPVVGRSGDGKPQRFYVGNKRDTTEAEAQRRLDYVRDLYDRQCAEHGTDYWAEWTLLWAQRLASGPPIKVYASTTAKANTGQAAEEVGVVRKLQSWGVPIEITDPDLEASGYGFIQNQIEVQVNRAVEHVVGRLEKSWGKELIGQARSGALPRDFVNAETRTLHEALDAYSKHLLDTGKRDQNGHLSTRTRKCRDRLEYLKEHHDDFPLWKLDLPCIQKTAAYWRNRPLTKRGNRCSWDHAHDMLKEFFRFLSWLDNHPAYKWEKPRGIEAVSRSPIKLPEDERQEAFQTTTKETYTPEQLAILAAHTDDFGRALLGVCVNCAFGASEVGQWNTNLYSIRKCHPHAEKLGMKSTDADSWIVGPRPKTGVYGEHLLWPEVADAVMPFLDSRKVLPMTNKGTPWYRTHSSNPPTKFNKWWNALLDRVEKSHPDFPRYSFGSLRDLLPDILRRDFSDDIASICLQHGQNLQDDLLKCYANVPFRKLFDATRQLEQAFRPFLDVLKVGVENPSNATARVR
jgi:hypothetical protein